MGRIYVVDDDPDVRHVVIYSLMDLEHEVTVHRDGEAAMEALLSDPPDALVLDVMMPGLDGYEVLAQMASWGLQDVTRTVVLTARATATDRKRALKLGADAFICKPFDPEHLAETVQELLELSPEDLRQRRARAVGALAGTLGDS
ncbi:MAG: response regulator transcription factor [Actinomycetota bacterium]